MGIFEIADNIYNNLSNYINEIYNNKVKVYKQFIAGNYPLVTFRLVTNILNEVSTCFNEKTRSLSFEVSIYAINDKEKTSQDIVKEIANVVNDYLENNFGMNGGINNFSPYYDGKIVSYQITFRYDLNIFVNRNRIY